MHKENKKISWGILGCARVAKYVLAPGIQRSRNGTLLGIASRSLSDANIFAEKFGVSRSYGTYIELIEDPDIDAVYIPLVNSLHKEWTIKAAQRGKHILCEKPLASNAVEAKEMVQVCKENGVLLMEAFAHRFHPQNLLAKSLIGEGRIGKVIGMTSIHSSGMPQKDDIRVSKQLSGGVLMDKGCYCVNTARFIFDSEPISAFANISYGKKSEVDERASAVLGFPNGGQVYFDTSFSLDSESYHQGYEVFGTEGRLLVPFGFAQLQTYRFGQIVDTHIFIQDNNGTQKIDVSGVHQWQLEAEYFADAILSGDKLNYPAEDGLLNMQVIDAIYRSGDAGHSESVSLTGS